MGTRTERQSRQNYGILTGGTSWHSNKAQGEMGPSLLDNELLNHPLLVRHRHDLHVAKRLTTKTLVRPEFGHYQEKDQSRKQNKMENDGLPKTSSTK